MTPASTSPSSPPSETRDKREARLEKQLDPNRLPRHVAIIPDGNGRWAKSHGWADRIKGHEAGIDAIRTIVECCARLHMEALSIYAFSKENWQRPRTEVAALMRLLRIFLVNERDELMQNNIRLIATGCLDDLPAKVTKELNTTRNLTASNNGMVLNLALSYSGREEITHCAREIARQAVAGGISVDDITPEVFQQHLYAPKLPDPDLLIRTSGEMRISNFLLWQLSYSEIYVTDVLWPDFRRVHLLEALVDFESRQRRFGKVG